MGTTTGYGLTVNASASRASGQSSGTDTTWSNAHVTAGNALTVQSGGDLNLRGAVAAGESVKADVGGNLNIGPRPMGERHEDHR